jgi:lipopolysaccharide transport system permease protein
MKKILNFINPHAVQPTSLLALIGSLIRNRQLIFQMIKREVIGRYRGSVIGLAWSFFNPIFMLSVYTVVFSVIFKARWGLADEENKLQFALILFAGMIILNLFIEVINRSPMLILSNANYVKKVIFPLETLPIVSIFTALFHTFISFFILIITFVAFNGYLNLTTLFIPVIIFPFLILLLGLSFILASFGVFLRDVGQTVSLITTLMTFLSPVFYPINAVPEKFQIYLMANPMTFIIEEIRKILIWGKFPNWIGLSIYLIIAIFTLQIGFVWFQKTRKGFADVI